jgi:hypothetical protein
LMLLRVHQWSKAKSHANENTYIVDIR